MKKMARRWLSMLLVVLMTIGMVPMQAFALEGELNITVRLFDESANRIYEIGKDTVSTGNSELIQSANYTIPAVSKFLNSNDSVGRVTKVTGSWYPSSGTSKNEGSVVEFATNNRNQSITYYVSSYYPNASGGGGESSEETVNVGSGSKTIRATLVYHSNYPNGNDITKTYNYVAKSYVDIFNIFSSDFKSFDDCGFTVPESYDLKRPSVTTGKNWAKTASGADIWGNIGLENGKTYHLYAQYTPQEGKPATPVTLTYMDGTQKLGEQSYFVRDEVTIIGLEDKSDTEFVGWSDKPDQTEADWKAGDRFAILSDRTLYAVWREKGTQPTDPTNPTDPATEYTITYKNNGEVIDVTTVPAGGDAVVKDAITDEEKEFSYWLGDDGNIYRPGDSITNIDKNYVLTAVWKGEEPNPDNPRDKENKPGIDKKVDNGDRTLVKPGDTVNFTLESNVPDNLSDYIDWSADPWNIVNPSTGREGTVNPENPVTPDHTTPDNLAPADLDTAVKSDGTAGSDTRAASEDSSITKGYYILTFHDVMSEGLDMNDDSLKVTIGGKDLAAGDYTFTTQNDDQCSFELSMDLVQLFNAGKFELNTDTDVKRILVTYSATYNGTEGSEGDGFKSTNKAWVDYTDKNPDDPNPPDEVEVVTGSISIIKIDQDTREPLEGAEFELYQDKEGTQQVGDTVTTDQDGKASFGSLKAGTYYLKETKAPDGYVGQEGLQEVTITEKDGEYLVTYEVPNKYVPHTGGAGTRMFTILGLAIMAGAGAAFVISRRKRED
ncbi:MAG: isopeptide-forming domain-containing fimbrial protein [Lachnospiraceae bacterium]|nr:isopeptide-forming domain-containing fimbrial protein [Lachnospiraceae bacterium]